MPCERKIKKQKDKRQQSLLPVPENSTCGGAMDLVRSDDGKTVWGKRCASCGFTWTKCGGCGRFFANVGAHLQPFDKEGNSNPCYDKNPEYRRAVKVAALRPDRTRETR